MDLEHEKRLTKVEQRSESNTHRLDKLEKRQDDLDGLIGAVNILAIREENLENDIKEIKVDVKTIAEKPGKRWDALVDKIILTLAAALIGFILAQIGLS